MAIGYWLWVNLIQRAEPHCVRLPPQRSAVQTLHLKKQTLKPFRRLIASMVETRPFQAMGQVLSSTYLGSPATVARRETLRA
jgi:hypothetical protein